MCVHVCVRVYVWFCAPCVVIKQKLCFASAEVLVCACSLFSHLKIQSLTSIPLRLEQNFNYVIVGLFFGMLGTHTHTRTTLTGTHVRTRTRCSVDR